jgi:RNA polymerase sigma-70 factor (ECF subfamily)
MGSQMANDAELAKRAAAGDREAAGEIYDRFAPLVRAILLDATGSLAEANELLQEVFLLAFSRLGQLQQPESLSAWLIGISRRQGSEFRRQAGRRRRRFVPLVAEVVSTEETDSDDVIEHVREAIRDLPERERLAVHMHYLCEQPAETAREALGLSSSGFYKLLERARRRLRARLSQLEKRS